MTIVDRQHAAELMTAKGRVYKFDAIECMINMLNQEQGMRYREYLVTDFSGNGALVDATVCTYLISDQMPCPMGAFLSAFQSPELAAEFQKSKGGELFSWKAINHKYNNTLR
jgi:copper chaperone NosL